MSVDWANRQRNTNKLARKIAKYLFEKDDISPTQLHGLSKLSWITQSYKTDNAGYIASTKIPAFEAIFGKSYINYSLKEVAIDIAEILNDDSVIGMIQQHSGFTNFYSAFRNSSLTWVENNFELLLLLYKCAYFSNSEEDREKLIVKIVNVPEIPKANHPEIGMKPEYFLTPAFFMLDKQIKFPLINGNDAVKNLLKALNVQGRDLLTQYSAMVSLYGVGGIDDAADLDQVGADLPDFISTQTKKAKKKLLTNKDTNKEGELQLKDEIDIEVIRKSGNAIQRRIHNQLTNQLKEYFFEYTLLEGCHNSCMFDVLVKNYDTKNDLLIEAKSSLERANIRMAIGQLYDYWFNLKGNEKPHIAILLPNKPDIDCIDFIEWMDIGLMWFEGNNLCTSTKWLKQLVAVS